MQRPPKRIRQRRAQAGLGTINRREPGVVYGFRRERGQRGFGLAVGLVFLWFAVWLSLFIGAIVVALHFILKYW